MDGDGEGEHQRQHHDVEDVEAEQRLLADVGVAEEHEAEFLADQRSVSGDGGADGDGPEGQLVPGQQVAGEA